MGRRLARLRLHALVVTVLLMVLLWPGAGLAQSLWLETGVAYLETSPQSYDPALKLGVRLVLPLSETFGLYLHPHLRAGLGLDGGAWLSFPAGLEDVPGLSSAFGAGLSLVNGRFGLAVSASLAYELNARSDLALVYTHRALLSPTLAQAFDLGVAYVIKF